MVWCDVGSVVLCSSVVWCELGGVMWCMQCGDVVRSYDVGSVVLWRGIVVYEVWYCDVGSVVLWCRKCGDAV